MGRQWVGTSDDLRCAVVMQEADQYHAAAPAKATPMEMAFAIGVSPLPLMNLSKKPPPLMQATRTAAEERAERRGGETQREQLQPHSRVRRSCRDGCSHVQQSREVACR